MRSSLLDVGGSSALTAALIAPDILLHLDSAGWSAAAASLRFPFSYNALAKAMRGSSRMTLSVYAAAEMADRQLIKSRKQMRLLG